MKKKKEIKKSTFKYWLILIIVLVAIVLLTPVLFKNLKFGLDLKGGFEILYEVESLTDEDLTQDMLESTYKTIARRIDEYGVSEPTIQIEGDNRIRVGLAGVKSPDEARHSLSQVASLTFRDTSDNLLMTSDVIKGAKVGTDESGLPAVSLQVKDKTKFYEVTKDISKRSDNTIVIWIDFEEGVDSYAEESATCGDEGSRCLSAARVSEAFSSDVIIQGNFTQDQVKNLVSNINSGSLPTKLTEISSKTVDASFGENSLYKTFTAGVIGMIIVILLIIFRYHFAGFLASVGLIVYTFLTFLIFWLIGGVLTLPGIAAMILGIGMAVDSNIINFARIKDELKNGKSLKEAYRLGNKNSLLTIIDANVTTFIAAIILFIFGESSIKGFATMLIISIFVTMLVMVVFTRYITTKFIESNRFNEKVNLFIGSVSKRNVVDIWKYKTKFIILTCILFIIGIMSLGINKLNLGIDFKGGTSVTLNTDTNLTEEEIIKDIEDLSYNFSSFTKDNDNVYTIILDNTLMDEQVSDISAYFNEKYDATVDVGVVSNRVKQDLVKNAISSLIIAIIGIVIYISIRFTFNYAIASIITLLHDAMMVIFVFSIFKLEVSTIFIAAILSILGYSINDTIVVFDRIREVKKTKYKDKIKSSQLDEIVSESIKNTLSRNIFTSLTTIIPVICLILFGSSEIMTFDIAMFVGLIAGSYSSLIIASYIWLLLEKRNINNPPKKKWYDIDEKEEIKIKGINS
jgi:SecD/SecF fusion protein